MQKEELKKKLQKEGFVHIYEWHDDSGVEYPEHHHNGKVSMYILNGGVTFWFDDKEMTITKGDRFDVPIGETHTAKVGKDGCDFLVGEMIKGDS